MAAEQLSTSRDLHYGTRGGGDGRGNFAGPLMRHDAKSSVLKELRCGRTAAVVLRIIQPFPQKESDFTAVARYLLWIPGSKTLSCSLITGR